MGMPIIISSRTTRSQAITDIVESVALEQAALSHILNAEGEKLQRVVAMPNVSYVNLMQVNRSVKMMVDSIASLESVLKAKLELFEGCLCEYY